MHTIGRLFKSMSCALQVKEILAYAAKRFIEVVPEIELPGHCGAALASYPHLGCKGAVLCCAVLCCAVLCCAVLC